LKFTLFIPPAIALVAVGGWLANQRQSIESLEKESTLLRLLIAAIHVAGSDPDAAKSTSEKGAKDKLRLDWKKIAQQFADGQRGGGMGDMRSMIRFQQQMQAMSKEELVAALDEIAGLGLTAEVRETLESTLLGRLIEKDPEFALICFSDRLRSSLQNSSGMLTWQLNEAFQKWADKDLGKATAWFDQQIAASTFDSKALDGKSQSRLQFERSLISRLLGKDPTAAASRMAGLPEDQRGDLARDLSSSVKEADQRAFADLVHGQVPVKKQAEALAEQASTIVRNGDYSKVDEYLKRIDATPEERTACVEKAVRSIFRSDQKKATREDFDAMWTWVSAQAHESLGKMTGNALANAAQGNQIMDFTEAAALAVQYNAATGNDEALDTFLWSEAARQNKEQARALAEQIVDDQRRAQILKRLK
jgi:hypothetical protein